MRATIFGLLLALWPTGACAAASTDMRMVDSALRADIPKGFSGAVLIADPHRVLLDRGYDSIRGMAVRTGSRFWIASAGKQFVSAAIMKCAERGWLTLDDPISRFIPDAPQDKRAITVKQLLAHLSGFGQTYASEGATNRDAAVAAILRQPLIDTPGTKFHYSNENYQLAAAIVEIVSGMDYRTFVTKEFFRPLGMRDTGFAFTSGAKPVLPAREEIPARLNKPMWGEAGVYSTTHDLYTWIRSFRSQKVLSSANIDTLVTGVTPIQEGQAALGWFDGKTTAGHETVFTRGNEDFGPNALIYLYVWENKLIIVLTHAGDADGDHSWSRFVLGQIEEKLGL